MHICYQWDGEIIEQLFSLFGIIPRRTVSLMEGDFAAFSGTSSGLVEVFAGFSAELAAAAGKE